MKSARLLASIAGLISIAFQPCSAPEPTVGGTVASNAAVALERFYVFPSLGRAAAARLRERKTDGAYDGMTQSALAAQLTADLAGVLHDKHVRVRYSAETLPADDPSGAGPSAAEAAAFAHFERDAGYGLGRIAHLPGNVGYVDVRLFPEPSAQRDLVIDGMLNAIASSDAIVLDLRRNHGGSPDAIARLLSHVLPPKTHLIDIVGRGDEHPPVAFSTFTGRVNGPPITAPLYVLTSHETFSGGEECAYDVQALKRGMLIGDVTGGGANPGSTHRLDDHFDMFVPDGRARSPITHANWEGVGVRPDVVVSADRALATAYVMALDATAAARSAAIGPGRPVPSAASLATMTDREILDL